MKRATARVVALLVAASVVGCSEDEGDGATPTDTSGAVAVPGASRDDVVASLTNRVIVPAYSAIVTATADLGVELDKLCAEPTSTAQRAMAQDAWRTAQDAWAATRAFRFGPAMELRTMAKIDFPIDPAKIEALLAGTDPVDPAAIAALGADKRGLGGIEEVLFGERPIDDRSCSYLVSANDAVRAAATRVTNAWQTDPPTDSTQFINESVNGMIFALVDVGDQQLGRAAGDITGTPEFADVDNGRSHGALADMSSMLGSVLALVEGADGPGLDILMAAQSADAADRLVAELADARAAVDGLASPLFAATETEAVSAAYEAVRVPLRTIRTEIASLLGVTLTLGDADGDS